MSTLKRILTPYEKNQLLKYGYSNSELKKTQIPVEYLTKHVNFMNLDFYVTPSVLIPRIETEELVQIAIKEAQIIHKTSPQKIINIADVGTGSGAIAIAVSKELKRQNIKHKITALDISPQALKIANKNHIYIDPNLPIKFLHSNLLSLLIEKNTFNEKIDIIIANLPYVPSKRIKTLDSSVKDFEPHLALDGGKDGLDLVKKLLIQAKQLISNSGTILLELDITHNQKKMTNENDNFWKIKTIESEYGGVIFGIIKN